MLRSTAAKERAEGAMDEYASYGRIYKINIFDATMERTLKSYGICTHTLTNVKQKKKSINTWKG